MATGFQAGTNGLVAFGASAASVVTSNARVKTASGLIGTVTDIVLFPSPVLPGNWLVPAMRCFVQNVPAITQTSQGIASQTTSAGPVPGPMQVTSPDTRASGT